MTAEQAAELLGQIESMRADLAAQGESMRWLLRTVVALVAAMWLRPWWRRDDGGL